MTPERRRWVVSLAVLGLLLVLPLGAAASIGGPSSPVAACAPGSLKATIGGKVACLRAGAPCRAALQAQYGRHGFVCRNGRLARKVTVPPAPPLPPPLPPLETAGHYVSADGNVAFDVLADGRTIANFVVVRLIFSCQPPGLSASIPVSDPGPVAIQDDKSFALDYTDSTGYMAHLNVGGAFDASGNAAGTLTVQASVTVATTQYQCSASLAWTATKQ